jgi:putative permease
LILDWLQGFLPHDHTLAQQVWREVDRQMGNYVRGKFLEVLVVWVATYVAFAFMGLQFAMLLAMMVGVSVIVPYIGAVVVTVPVALVAFFQWGWGSEFLWLLGVYLIIQGLDGNVLVPLLFSEVVDLHPIAIIVGGAGVRRSVGVLGGVFRHPFGDRGAIHSEGVAAADAGGGIADSGHLLGGVDWAFSIR